MLRRSQVLEVHIRAVTGNLKYSSSQLDQTVFHFAVSSFESWSRFKVLYCFNKCMLFDSKARLCCLQPFGAPPLQ